MNIDCEIAIGSKEVVCVIVSSGLELSIYIDFDYLILLNSR